MSNEPTHLTQFQQKAQLRLQEMEVEWRRTLFERFRVICREEMMDVMKALLSSMPGSEEMERKLAHLEEKANTNQMELFSTMSQTSEDVRNLAKKLENQPLGTDPQLLETLAKGQETISKQVATKQEETARLLQEDMRTSAQLSRSTLLKAVVITTVVVMIACAAAVFSLRILSNSAMVNEADLRKRDQLTQQNATLTADAKTLLNSKDALSKEIQDLTTRREALQAEIRQSTETQRVAAATLATMQQQITQLQQIQEQFRFKLVKGESGGVFVEVPADAQPFQYQDKLYIQIK